MKFVRVSGTPAELVKFQYRSFVRFRTKRLALHDPSSARRPTLAPIRSYAGIFNRCSSPSPELVEAWYV